MQSYAFLYQKYQPVTDNFIIFAKINFTSFIITPKSTISMKKFYTLLIVSLTFMAARALPVEPMKFTTQEPAPIMAPRAPAAAADADYTGWTSLGIGQINNGLQSIERSLNFYRYENDEEIVFTKTTEVFVRELKNDPSKKQFKFTAFLGYNDIIVDLDAASALFSSKSTPTGMPVPQGLANGYGCTSIDFVCNAGSYSEARRIFTFENAWFILFDNMGWQCNFTISLPDAKPEIGIKDLKLVAGGTRSTDKSCTFQLELNGIDHVRYIIRHEQSFSYDDIADIATGNIEYKETSDNIEIVYNQGHGIYRCLILAFDANDKYTGIYTDRSVLSNLAPEGTWESIGKGTWYHPYLDYYMIYDFETGGSTTYNFPAEALKWEVEIEKRTDTDRDIYRVVNPYSPTCGLADTFNSLLDKMYTGDEAPYRPNAFRTDDTFWFVFDVTDPENILIEQNRPNGIGNSHFATTDFYCMNSEYSSQSRFKDNSLLIPSFSEFDLRIDLPNFRGFGFETLFNYDGNVMGSVCPSTAEVRYVIIPSTGVQPTTTSLIAEAARIADGTTTYEVHKVNRSVETGDLAVLPYADYITAPSWMLIVPFDNNGTPFDYDLASLPFTTEITGVSLDECLISNLGIPNGDATVTDLTITKEIEPDAFDVELYTLPNPYKKDIWWKSEYPYTEKDAADWCFKYNPADNTCTFVNDPSTGLSFPWFEDYGYKDATVTLVLDFGTKVGDDFVFPLYAIDFYSGEYRLGRITSREGAKYVFHIKNSDGIESIEADSNADAPVEYYDMQGRRIVNPSNGIYIRRQGTKASKVYIK